MNDTNKFTKGEWKIKVGNYPNSYFLQSIVDGDEQAEANAKLMEAAQDMLAALKAVVIKLDLLILPADREHSVVYKSVVNAIKKATS